MAHWKGFAIATGKAAWKTGAFLLKWGGKPAAKGTVWTIKKVAVDPAAKKITNMKMVERGLNAKAKVAALREAIKNAQCAACGKATRSSWLGGQDHFCSASCAQGWAETYNEVEQVKVPDTIDGNENSLYLVCGCNRKSKFHGGGCTANKASERVAENVVWSEKNPNYMKAAEQPKERKMTPEERRRAAIQEDIRQNPPKKKWHGGY